MPTLKIRENSIIGYFVEVPQSQAAKVPLAKFTPCQTVSGACRFKSEVRVGDVCDDDEFIITISSFDLGLSLLTGLVYCRS